MYTINQKDAIKETLSPISESELERQFDNELDAAYHKVDVCGYEYHAYDVLKSHDPVVYRREFLNWLIAEMLAGRITDEIDGEHYDQVEVDELMDALANEEE